MTSVLMHTCCAPCSLSCIDPLRAEGIEPVAFWYNPNIHPWKEYEARRDCLLTYAPTIEMQVIVDEDYGLRTFVEHVASDIDHRCTYCYQHRLEETARYAAEHGAASVLGVDISAKMIAKARSMGNEGIIEYRCMPMEDILLPEASFDIVLSSLAFHYTPDFQAVCRNVSRWLKPEGAFIFSVEHPVFTAQGTQDWHYDESGQIMHWPVDGYFMEGPRQAVFLGEEVTKYHRTLTSYLGALAAGGFEVTAMEEPKPSRELLDSVPGMQEELRRPMMLIISARKK